MKSLATMLAMSLLANTPLAVEPPAAVAPRTMRLLAKSTAEKPAHIRILFYGQSITRQEWWLEITENLRNQYPTAVIDSRNLAVGGFAAQRLIITTPRDLAEVYPDLLIFHVYGSHVEYEGIIRLARSMTTAEIVMQTDHFSAKVDPAKPDAGWGAFMNGRFLPAVATRYGCDLLDVRAAWRRHLLGEKLAPEALLMDGVHLNEAGCHFMATTISGALQPAEPTAPADAWVTDHAADPLLSEGGKRLRLTFNGNRAEAFLKPGFNVAASRVLIDGRPPSTAPGCVLFSRPNAGPEIDWPWDVCGPIVIASQNQPEPQDWSITVTEGDADGFRFKVEGGKTGPDGEGSSKERFVSPSGHIVIGPEHWWTQTAKGRPNPIAPGYVWRFVSYSLGADDLSEARPAKPGCPVVLASNLAPGKHTLEIQSDGPLPVAMVRTYRPPLVENDPSALGRVSDTLDPNTPPATTDKSHLRPIE